MPHSLRVRLSGLRYKKIISDKDYDRLCKALDNENVLDKIRDEIEELDRYYDNDYFSTNNRPMYACSDVLEIIDKHKAESEKEYGRNEF